MTIFASPTPGANRVPIADGLGKLNYAWLPTVNAANTPIADAGDYFVGTDVEAALQELGAVKALVVSVALAPGVNTADSVAIASIGDVSWDVSLVKSGERYSTTVRATHNGTTPFHTQNNVTMTSGTIDVTLDVDISGGQMRLRATTGSSGWAAHVRRHSLDA